MSKELCISNVHTRKHTPALKTLYHGVKFIIFFTTFQIKLDLMQRDLQSSKPFVAVDMGNSKAWPRNQE